MTLYKEILSITKKIEEALKNEDLSKNLALLIEERIALFAQLQSVDKQNNREIIDCIEQILKCEERCAVLAKDKRTMLKKAMQDTQNNKRRHVAYSRQMASPY
jgi:hypothetical protein